MRRLFIAAVLVVTAACTEPGPPDVRGAFLRANPGAQVESTTAGEGDGGTVYYHIRYRVGTGPLRETVWQYTKAANGVWQNTWRDSPRVVAGQH